MQSVLLDFTLAGLGSGAGGSGQQWHTLSRSQDRTTLRVRLVDALPGWRRRLRLHGLIAEVRGPCPVNPVASGRQPPTPDGHRGERLRLAWPHGPITTMAFSVTAPVQKVHRPPSTLCLVASTRREHRQRGPSVLPPPSRAMAAPPIPWQGLIKSNDLLAQSGAGPELDEGTSSTNKVQKPKDGGRRPQRGDSGAYVAGSPPPMAGTSRPLPPPPSGLGAIAVASAFSGETSSDKPPKDFPQWADQIELYNKRLLANFQYSWN